MQIKWFLYFFIFIFVLLIQPIETPKFFKNHVKLNRRVLSIILSALSVLIVVFLISYLDGQNIYSKIFRDNALMMNLNGYLLNNDLLIATLALIFSILTLIINHRNQQKSASREQITHMLTELNKKINEVSSEKINQLLEKYQEIKVSSDFNYRFYYELYNDYVQKNNKAIQEKINTLKNPLEKNVFKRYFPEKNDREKNKIFFSYLIFFKLLPIKIDSNDIPTTYRRRNDITYKEGKLIEESTILTEINKNLLSQRKGQGNNSKYSYKMLRDLFNEIGSQNEYMEIEELFRFVHRVVKIINSSILSEKEKTNFLGMLRANISNNLLTLMYYNCTYTQKGIGLGIQLAGTNFFGEKKDFQIKKYEISFSQHIPHNLLHFKIIDFHIIINVYSDCSIYPGTLSFKKFLSKIDTQISKTHLPLKNLKR